MNDIIRAVILGIVEGLTEFLPVSSTGHMILVMPWIGIDDATDPFWNDVFNFFIQIGAILAVVIYFWQRLWKLTFHAKDGNTVWTYRGDIARSLAQGLSALTLVLRSRGRLWQLMPHLKESGYRDHILFKIFIAMLPAAVLGVLFDDFMKAHLMKPVIVASALVLGGVIIIVIEQAVRKPRFTDAATITAWTAFLIGLIQCLAMIPGTSRSGATIMGALLLGLAPPAAAEFSFFLAIPTLLGAGLLSLIKGLDTIHPGQGLPLAVGFVVSFLVAWAVVALFMRFIQSHKFTSFAIYRIIIGIVVLVALWNGEATKPRPASPPAPASAPFASANPLRSHDRSIPASPITFREGTSPSAVFACFKECFQSVR